MPPRATRLPSPDTSSVADAVPDLVASVLGVPAISVSRAVRLDSAENRVFRVCVDGRPLIIRMTPESRRSESEVRAELAWLRFLGQHGIAVVRPVSKDPAAVRLRDGERVNLVMFDYIHGLPPQPDAVDIDLLLRWGKLLSGMRTASDAVP